MHASSFVLGYHGCDREVGERILAGQHVTVSNNKHDWLGGGAYFWENDPQRALYWAELIRDHPQHFRHKIKDPFVIGAVIDPGQCLDLTEADHLDLLRKAHDHMVETFALIGTPLPENEPGFPGDIDLVKRNLDCAVVNYLHQVREDEGVPPYQTVRAAFFGRKTPL